MNLREAEELLLDLELFGMRFGLDRMYRLTTALGMPQRRYASIHVVGTNGKSSTVRMTAAILERHGISTGTFTSPHLRSFAERIEAGERVLGPEEFAAAVSRAWRAAELVNRALAASAEDPSERDEVTQFELLTATAFHALAERGVEAGVIEAGLGGRYDATNVIPSKVQVLTSVGLEHTRWLGPTLTDIAREKLDVVTDHGTLVVGDDLHPDALAVARQVSAARSARLVEVGLGSARRMRARGSFQQRNFALAEAAAEALLGQLDGAAVSRAAGEVEVPGRAEIVGERPLTIIDAAHNPDAAKALAGSLEDLFAGRPLTAVLSILDDKDAAAMLGVLLPHCERVVFTRSRNPRALSPATLESLAEKLGGPPAEVVPDPRAALERARELAGPDGAVLATGSIYLLADLVAERRDARTSAL